MFDHTVFFSLYVWPTPILMFFLSSFTVLFSLATLTLHFALWLYLVSVHVIVHEPILLAVTLPDASTVAIDELDVDHSAVFLAFSGFITFLSLNVLPTAIYLVAGESENSTALSTCTRHVAIKPPSSAWHWIIASPAPTPVTSPFSLTVTTPSSSDW